MSTNSYFKNLFNQLDLYGLSFPLRYRNHKLYNTLCGIILSLITIFAIFAVFLYFLIKVINRYEMSIISNTEHLYIKRLFNFSNNPILIGFFKNGEPIEIDSTYIKITLDKNDHYPDKDKDGIINIRRESIQLN